MYLFYSFITFLFFIWCCLSLHSGLSIKKKNLQYALKYDLILQAIGLLAPIGLTIYYVVPWVISGTFDFFEFSFIFALGVAPILLGLFLITNIFNSFYLVFLDSKKDLFYNIRFIYLCYFIFVFFGSFISLFLTSWLILLMIIINPITYFGFSIYNFFRVRRLSTTSN